MSFVEIALKVTDPETEQEEPLVAHIARSEDIVRAFVNGDAIQALCGKIWVPTRDAAEFPVCERCKEVYKRIQNARMGNN